jgi:hypothetical protein
MREKPKSINQKLLWPILIALAIVNCIYAIQPSGPTSYENVSSESPLPSIGQVINTTGGTITTINFEATTQNPRWKGFVGNASGSFALMDASNFSLYDWSLASVQGEIYATRNESIIDWNSVACANAANILAEETTLGFTPSDEDNINRTFNMTTHDSFYAGDTFIAANSCYSTYLNVNGTYQTTDFQELLLYYNNLIYVALVEDEQRGFDNQSYDYQMILPENTDQGKPSETYYFYIELI